MQRVVRGFGRFGRRAAVIVQVAVSSTLVLGMGALAIDVGMLYTAQSEVQVSADAAALAAAAQLATVGEVEDLAVAAANQYAAMNTVLGMRPAVYPEDVEFGGAVPDFATGQIAFDPDAPVVDAVRVTVRHVQSEDPGLKPALSLPLAFANVFGVHEQELQARAAAVLVPRDIAVVVDLSNSMCYDSTLRSDRVHRRDGGYCNLRDVWCALDGPEPSRPYVPATADNVDGTEYECDTGPTYGEMKTWGSPLVPNVYKASTDPGLWYIPKNSTCSVSAAQNSLSSRGYNSTERSILLSGSRDGSYSSQWKNRVKVILGLAVWHSGKYGGMDPAGGDGDNYVESNELTMVVPEPACALNWNWDTYISYSISGFQYYYGLKTLTDFMLDSRPQASATDGLWMAPEQPLRAIKDAVLSMTDVIESLESMDQVSLEVFCGAGENCRHVADLSDELDGIPAACYTRQSGHYDVYTNIGGGMWKGICELTSERARGAAAKVIVLLSDGCPNKWDQRYTLDGIDDLDDPDSPQSWSDASAYALAMARIAARQNARIYTISVGQGADRALMQQIASIGRGIEFYADGDPTTYTAELREIFEKLGGARPVQLIE